MSVRTYEGEGIEIIFPCDALVRTFCGVTVYRFTGTKEQLMYATEILNDFYPLDDKEALEDARVISQLVTKEFIYEVIIVRREINAG